MLSSLITVFLREISEMSGECPPYRRPVKHRVGCILRSRAPVSRLAGPLYSFWPMLVLGLLPSVCWFLVFLIVVLLFCGVPGSGKTTIAQIVAKHLAAFGRVVLLTSDKLRPPVYRKFYKAVETNAGKTEFLILDATFYKKEWRERIEALAGRENVLTIYLDCPLEIALQRNRDRQPNIPERAIHIIFHQMQRPEKPAITIDCGKMTPFDAAEKIIDYMQDRRILASRPEQ